MEDLADMVDDNGSCVVENFSVGRKGNVELHSDRMGQLANNAKLVKFYFSPLICNRLWVHLLPW